MSQTQRQDAHHKSRDQRAERAKGKSAPPVVSAPSERLDKWLHHARFAATRSKASKLCAAEKVRVNGEIITKAHFQVRPGMVLTFPQGRHIRVIHVLGIPDRRGPAVEAQGYYADLDPPTADNAIPDLVPMLA